MNTQIRIFLGRMGNLKSSRKYTIYCTSATSGVLESHSLLLLLSSENRVRMQSREKPAPRAPQNVPRSAPRLNRPAQGFLQGSRNCCEERWDPRKAPRKGLLTAVGHQAGPHQPERPPSGRKKTPEGSQKSPKMGTKIGICLGRLGNLKAFENVSLQ